MGQLTERDILEQSRTAYAQWKDKWHSYAKINGDIYKKSQRKSSHLTFSGYGKQIILCGMGSSLEDHIDYLREIQTNPLVDIGVVDKGFRTMIQKGIKPKFVFLADAGVDFEKWVGDDLDKTEGVNLISNITANPEWTTKWKGPVYFYVNRDNIKTQDIFIPISGCNEMIPASSNVGNSTAVFSVQYMNYDEYLLVGFDFGWNYNGNYYAFNDNDKRYWMKHMQGIGIDGEPVYTSANLQFSRKWLEDYCGMAGEQGIKIFNCSGRGILNWNNHELKKRILKFKPRPEDKEIEKTKLMAKAEKVKLFGDEINSELYKAMERGNVVGVEIAYIPAGVQ
jgi:hypothetical protein